jgi:hypothetical protein
MSGSIAAVALLVVFAVASPADAGRQRADRYTGRPLPMD